MKIDTDEEPLLSWAANQPEPVAPPPPEPAPIPSLTAHESDVLTVLRSGKHTQAQIAAKVVVGWHPKHEAHLPITDESTLRKIRQIIRDLRLNHGVKILSDIDGYWITESQEEAKEYLERIERTAKAQAKSHMVTYHMMSNLFGLKSEYFDKQSIA